MELLITLAIISMLVGLLLPAFSAVRKAAREVKQKAQLTGIELALGAFKNDYGDYPPSNLDNKYCGSQKLAEALLGRDLMGFHPKSTWSATDPTWYPDPAVTPPPAFESNLKERKGPYLELATANVFRLGDSSAGDGLFDSTNNWLAPDRYVICDVFGIKKITLPPGKTAVAGTPILYYKANTSSKTMVNDPTKFDSNIYNIRDNGFLVSLGRITDGAPHPLVESAVFYGNPSANPPVIGYIQDPKVTAWPWPYRPDSYILISAGADGFYGTPDDIRNFGY
jgi:type II secretory pathway pseudopilin PulG